MDDMILTNYFRGFIVKMLENFSSAKMLMFFMPFVMSTAFMGYYMFQTFSIVQGILSVAEYKLLENCGNIFIAWCTFNVSLASTIVAVREIFKIKKLKALANGSNQETKRLIEKVKI